MTAEAREALQERFDRLNAVLFGMQDYHIVARQGVPAAPSKSEIREQPARA